ncbi:uncharacterized protein LOC115885401 [Sitophilus oryzae]|uniref:Uncharacterized protein LOC115885401 n=1 Tax=Sitophilus oryzae TaxID=7048 RepID=A0A6J2Y9K0_SITOR|nr:uncharacterized protein LOC115885401 [Sitophilus oryzae]
MALAGTYELVKSEGVDEFYKALTNKTPEKKVQQSKKLEIAINGDQVTLDCGAAKTKATYTLGNNAEGCGSGSAKNAIAKLSGNVLIVLDKNEHGLIQRSYKLSGSELTVTLTSSKKGVPTAQIVYIKVK